MQKREKKSAPRLGGWVVLSVISFLIFACVLGGVLYVQFSFSHEVDLTLYRSAGWYRSPQFFAYRFTDRQNREGSAYEVTDTFYAEKKREHIPYSELEGTLTHAFVAIEDKRFFEHHGVDWYRTVAAGANYILGFSDHFGASTITQQLIKNMSGENEVSLHRKLQEILYAIDLERHLGKSEILELYLNVISFSDGCVGIGEAAEHYFSKRVGELTPAECATLAAIINNPTYYNPIRHPEHNLSRRNLILSEMYAQGYLSETDYRTAVETPLSLAVNRDVGREGINSWYTDTVISDVIHDLMQEYGMSRSAASHLLYTGGLRIDMALDEDIQKEVEDYYRTTLVLPKNAKGESAESAIVVIDPKTGDLLGIAGAGGVKSGNHLQNFATQTKRPPGSTLKPLSVYAPALEEGLINWASVYDDVPVEFDYQGHSMWPKNANGVYRGLCDISYAVAHSTNTVAVRVLDEVGLRNSYRYVTERFKLKGLIDGKEESDCNRAALALGQLHYGVTLRDLCASYTPFADGGVRHEVRSYYRVLGPDGKVLLSKPDGGEVVLSRETSAIMTKLLEGVVKEGSGNTITLSDRVACAGKTGTSNNDCDRWFVGYTPDMICGVWCGYEYPEPLIGKNLSTQTWNAVMERITAKNATRNFAVPSTVTEVDYCMDSGHLLTEACRHDPRGNRTGRGWFKLGDEPSTPCDRHVLVRYYNGVCHSDCPVDGEEVALIRVTRQFSREVTVRDAEYVYFGDPMTMEPNPDPTRAYFAVDPKLFYGKSGKGEPYNRSCREHFRSEEESDPRPWEVPLPAS